MVPRVLRSYRKALPVLARWSMTAGAALRDGVLARGRRRLERALIQITRHHGPEGILARTVPTGNTVLWVALVLAVMLLLNYV